VGTGQAGGGLTVVQFRVGVDIGGTFTDIVFLGDDGAHFTRKVSSTVEDYARAIAEGLSQLMSERGVRGGDIVELLHGTTVASNAILELKGARTGLITTRGFRDVLEIRTLRMPRLYDISWTKPPPLIERHLRFEVDERVNFKGEIERALDEAQVERVVQRLLDAKVEAIAVCLLHSYANPTHERLIKAVIERMAPDITLCISAEVLPEIKEYERTSTTTINAYVRPIVASYLASLTHQLRTVGIKAPLLLMQSNGGLTTAQAAAVKPMNIIESGPAAGVIGVQALARRIGVTKAISFDMGGTTAKASLIEHGEVTRASEYAVGGGIMAGSRLLSGAGYALKVPAIDLAEVGAGGGSIVWIDAGGALQVGPRSAGASPGPVCYGLGGTEPTITDANVVLGYINPSHLVGGALKLDASRSRSAIEENIARPLGMSVEQAAYGAHLIAASSMIRAIKSVSSERGRDPRDYLLVGFGGNGPLFAPVMAGTLQIRDVLIPPSAGVFSSYGLLFADVEYHFTRTRRALLAMLDPAEVEALYSGLEQEALTRLREDGFAGSATELIRSASLHYQGQSFELSVPVPSGALDHDALLALAESYGVEHERTYGHRAGPEEPVELVTLKVVGRAIPDTARSEPITHDVAARTGNGKDARTRMAWFGPAHGWLNTAVIERAELAVSQAGPCIVEEYDSTCLIPPGWTARLDRFGNIALHHGDVPA
jgi:N-methylhydantoinase A